MRTILVIDSMRLVLPEKANVGAIFQALSQALPVKRDWDHERAEGSMDFRPRYKPAELITISMESAAPDQFVVPPKRVPKSHRLADVPESRKL